MAKLLLKFEDRIIDEVSLYVGTVTIGRQPDNRLHIDNPAVSGHHAKVYSEGNYFVLEDAESFNGTYVDGHRISKIVLKDGDKAVIGKHTIEFRDSQSQAFLGSDGSLQSCAQRRSAGTPQLDRTVFLDTAKAKEMLATALAAASAGGSDAVQNIDMGQSQTPVSKVHVAHQTIGTLTIVKGRTDQKHYLLTSQLTVIGKSKMAGIRLKRWCAPRVVASIYRGEDGYFIAASADNVKIRLNGTVIESRTRLDAGQVIEVAGIKAVFDLC